MISGYYPSKLRKVAVISKMENSRLSVVAEGVFDNKKADPGMDQPL